MRISADYFALSGATVSYFGSMRVDAPAVTIRPHLRGDHGHRPLHLGRGRTARQGQRSPRPVDIVPRCGHDAAHHGASGSPGSDVHLPLSRLGLPGRRVRAGLPGHRLGPVRGLQHRFAPLKVVRRRPRRSRPMPRRACKLLSDGAQERLLKRPRRRGERGLERRRSVPRRRPALLALARPASVGGLLFHARPHDLGPSLYGIMFDQQGKQRQGCAVFYAGIGGTRRTRGGSSSTRASTRSGTASTCSLWQKSLATPPQPNRPASPSRMNYPWRFPGGPAAFWTSFPFRFDAQELVHIRHAFRNDLVMGGNPFGTGEALDDLESWREPVEDRSGIRLELAAPPSFAFGAPVTVEVKLDVRRRARRPRDQAHPPPQRAMSRSRSPSPAAASSSTERAAQSLHERRGRDLPRRRAAGVRRPGVHPLREGGVRLRRRYRPRRYGPHRLRDRPPRRDVRASRAIARLPRSPTCSSATSREPPRCTSSAPTSTGYSAATTP